MMLVSSRPMRPECLRGPLVERVVTKAGRPWDFASPATRGRRRGVWPRAGVLRVAPRMVVLTGERAPTFPIGLGGPGWFYSGDPPSCA